jgi:hypothetical protein
MTASWSGKFTTDASLGTTTAAGDSVQYTILNSTQMGDIQGHAVGLNRLVIHPDGTQTSKIVITFTGTILGSAPGTATFTIVRSGNATYQSGPVVINHGTGGLTGIHAYGTSTVDITPTGGIFSNTVQVWFSK